MKDRVPLWWTDLASSHRKIQEDYIQLLKALDRALDQKKPSSPLEVLFRQRYDLEERLKNLHRVMTARRRDALLSGQELPGISPGDRDLGRALKEQQGHTQKRLRETMDRITEDLARRRPRRPASSPFFRSPPPGQVDIQI